MGTQKHRLCCHAKGGKSKSVSEAGMDPSPPGSCADTITLSVPLEFKLCWYQILEFKGCNLALRPQKVAHSK